MHLRNKVVSILLAASMAASLMACGGSSGASSSGSSEAAAPAAEAAAETTETAEAAPEGIPEGVELQYTDSGVLYADAEYTGYNGGEYTLTIAHTSPTESKSQYGALYVANNIAIRSGGKINVVIYPALQMGNDRESMESCIEGNLDMTMVGATAAGFCPQLMFGNIPYLFSDHESFNKWCDGPFQDWISQKMSDASGLSILGIGILGIRQCISMKPVHSVADLQGVKIRCQENAVHTAVFNGIGATAVPIPAADVYQGFEQGVVQAADQDYAIAYEKKWQEVAKYWSNIDWTYDPWYIFMNDAKLNSLDDEARKIVEEEVFKWGNFDREFAYTYALECRDKAVAENNIEVYEPTEEELQGFKDAMQAPGMEAAKKLMSEEDFNTIMGFVEEAQQ